MATARPPAPVQLTGVTKTFGSRTAVSKVSFALRPGTVTGYLGPYGAGKTTTLRMIGGLIRRVPARPSCSAWTLAIPQPGRRWAICRQSPHSSAT